MAIEFKEPWYREQLPLRVVIGSLEEILGSILMILHKAESPQTFHTKITR